MSAMLHSGAWEGGLYIADKINALWRHSYWSRYVYVKYPSKGFQLSI